MFFYFKRKAFSFFAKSYIRLCGFNCGFEIEWDDINLQDTLELSQARYNNARATQIEIGNETEVIDE